MEVKRKEKEEEEEELKKECSQTEAPLSSVKCCWVLSRITMAVLQALAENRKK